MGIYDAANDPLPVNYTITDRLNRPFDGAIT